MSPQDAYKFSLLVLAIWREARGEPFEAKLAVANVIRNRVNSSNIKQWGLGWDGVILHPWQFSSFNRPTADKKTGAVRYDANAFLIPLMTDPSLGDCIKAAEMVWSGNALDNTGNATYYHDDSMDAKLPPWAASGETIKTVDVGSFRFYKKA